MDDVRSDLTPEWKAQRRELGSELMRRMYEAGLLRTWLRDRAEGWELVSGIWSPFYVQCRPIPSDPVLFSFVGRALGTLIAHEAPEATRLVGVAAAGVPLASAAALAMQMPMAYTRKLPGARTLDDVDRAAQEYGEHALVEGDFRPSDRLVLVDDVVARFTSKEVANRQVELELKKRGVEDVRTVAIAVLIDREQGAAEAADAAGLKMLSVVRLASEGLAMLEGIAAERELEIIRAYLDDNEAFQDHARREALRVEAVAYQQERGSSPA